MDVTHFLTTQSSLTACPGALRSGRRAVLADKAGDQELFYVLAGQIPYYYRRPDKIAAEFAARHHALEMVYDLATRLPKRPKHQRSHFGEILAAEFVEKALGLRRLYCKLTLLTAEDTNAHKMDGFFVDLSLSPFRYFAVEAKASILPTPKTPFRGHRKGILRRLIRSLDTYEEGDARFDLVAIRDNLEAIDLPDSVKARIRQDLVPPGPDLSYVGVATINHQTVCDQDDEFILTAACQRAFTYEAIAVTDVAALAKRAYGKVRSIRRSRQP